MASIKWNPKVRLILSDVDETVADLYLPADEKTIKELTLLLGEGVAIFFITGQGLKSVMKRIVDKIPKILRWRILVGHCSGAEVWGFTKGGELDEKPFYSIYEEKLNTSQKLKFREVVNLLIKEFELKTYPTMPIQKFIDMVGSDPLSVLFEDRGPQITFEMVNAYDLSDTQVKKLKQDIPNTHGHFDLRIPVLEMAEKLFTRENLPITPRLGGEFALDLAVEGVSKTTAVRYILENPDILNTLELTSSLLNKPEYIEIWGDKFSVIRGGTDRHMCEAVNPKVRAIDFRNENPDEFLKGYNIIVWDGKKHLHEGLLEYLQSRN
jgi:hydroxymethylpyrimidine pyrophosphatase-like HAD family hydrolase